MLQEAKPEGEAESTQLAKQIQNPVADLISVPFQLNSGFGTGARNNTQNTLYIQPVIPQSLDEDWNWIHRPIVPLLNQVSYSPGTDSATGLGNIAYEGFLSPAKPEGMIWGVGPLISAPTRTEPELGPHEWAAGPAAVALAMDGPWVYGCLVSQSWGVASHPDTNLTQIQPFVNFNFGAGWYLVSSPIATANWRADQADDIWTVPLGGGIGRVFHIGERPVNVTLQAYQNVHRPHEGSQWSTRLQFTLLYPKKKS